MTPVCIINGPLGSGKTTLIHSLLKKSFDASKTLWLKTEFGEQSLDEYVLQDTQVQTQALTGGCICHVLLSELDRVFTDIEKNESVEAIIIETSGMSHPEPVVQTIERHPSYIVGHRALVVDVAHAGDANYPKPMELPAGSDAPYDVLVFNKYPLHMDVQAESKIEQRLDPWFDGIYLDIDKYHCSEHQKSDTTTFDRDITEWSERIQKDIAAAQIDTSPKDPIRVLREVSIEDGEEYEDHEGDMDVLTFRFSPNHCIERKKLEVYAAAMPKEVIRVKGIIHTQNDTWTFFNWARGQGNWLPVAKSASEQVLIVIGHGISNNDHMPAMEL